MLNMYKPQKPSREKRPSFANRHLFLSKMKMFLGILGITFLNSAIMPKWNTSFPLVNLVTEVIQPGTVNICQGGNIETISPIIVMENKVDDFNGTGLITLYFDSPGIEIDTSEVNVQIHNQKPGDYVKLVLSPTKDTLHLTCNFTGLSQNILNLVIISGLKVKSISTKAEREYELRGSGDVDKLGLGILPPPVFAKVRSITSPPATITMKTTGGQTIASEDSHDLNGENIVLEGIPAGGRFFGQGVDVGSNQFYPRRAGVGEHYIKYTHTNSNGCTRTDSVSISILSPISEYALKDEYCKQDTNTYVFKVGRMYKRKFGLKVYVSALDSVAGIETIDGPLSTKKITCADFATPTNDYGSYTYTFNPSKTQSSTVEIKAYWVKYTLPLPWLWPWNCRGKGGEVVLKKIRITDVSDTDFTGIDTTRPYCINAGPIGLYPLVNGDTIRDNSKGSGFFRIINKATNDTTRLLVGQNTFDPQALHLMDGNYRMQYTYRTKAGCQASSPFKSFTLVNAPSLAVEGISSGGYCIRNSGPVKLRPNIGGSVSTPPLEPDKAFFMIRRVSVPRTSFEPLKANGVLTDTLDPNHPIPSEPAIGPNATYKEWNHLAGEYAIRYLYIDGAGCNNLSHEVSVTLHPLPVLTFLGLNLNKNHCSYEKEVSLTPYDGGEIITTAVDFQYRQVGTSDFKSFGTWGHVFKPNKLNIGQYEIKFEYTNSNGCKVSSEIQTVQISIAPKNVHVTAIKDYNKNSMQFIASADDLGTGGRWFWDFKDGTTSNQRIDTKFFEDTSPQPINYALNVSTATCDTTITKNFQIDFSVKGHCIGDTTKFENKSLLGDAIGKVSWDFGDKIGSSDQKNPSYTYQTPGTYWVKMSITTQDGFATYVLRRRIDIFPVVKVSQQQFYTQGFENGAAGWITHGVVDVNNAPKDSSSWTLKQPNGFVIKSNTGNAWITDNRTGPTQPNASAHYNSNEQSYVESPCFDIRDLNKPMLSFNYWSHTDKGSDGVTLLYTYDDGKTWHRLGKKDFGIDWYNSKSILGAPGKSSREDVNPDDQGWSGKSQASRNKWRVARYSLTEALIKMEKEKVTQRRIRLRMAFGSNGDNPSNDRFEGFAFDNVAIGNRNRVVLMEYFINEGIANAEMHSQEAKKFPKTGNHNEVISIHYHTDFPKKDVLNSQNEKDPGARAFFHGIREVPRAVIDGYFNDFLMSQWAQDYFADRTLIVAPFNIDIGQPKVVNETLQITAQVTALRNFNRPVTLHVVLMDSVVNINGKTFYNVVRKMLPDAAGTFRKAAWQLRDTQSLDFQWKLGEFKSETLRVVVFIEDYETREVHQAAVTNVQTKRTTEGQSEHVVANIAEKLPQSRMQLFPNPVSKQAYVTLKTAQTFSKEAFWEIIAYDGKVIKKGKWSIGQKSKRLNIQGLLPGLYICQIVDQGQVYQLRFEKQ